MVNIQKPGQDAEQKGLKVGLVSQNEKWRNAMADVLSKRQGVQCNEISSIPSDANEFALAVATKFDIILLDVDSDPEQTFRIAEAVCSKVGTCVMATSSHSEVKQAIRFMRVGVREFFTLPVDPAEVTAALKRAAERPPAPPAAPNTTAKLFVFLGTKGGVGVTTLAANFSLALTQETGKKVLVIDFGLPLGDLAINLGTNTQYSVLNALLDPGRLDGNFLDTIVTRHASGLSILGAPPEFSDAQPTADAFDKLIAVARIHYDYVVVDAGSRPDFFQTSLFEQCTTIYLITQVGISELRNAFRMITQYFATRGRSLQVVVNRYTQRALLFDDAQITKTLTRETNWKVPDDYAAARRTRESGAPLAEINSPLSNAIREMARDAGEVQPEVKKGGFFRLRR